MKKQYCIYILMILTIVTLVACREKTNKKEVATGSAVASSSAVQQKTLREKSEEYAGQLASGVYDVVYDVFDQELRAQLSREQLQQSWKTATAGVERFQGIQKTEEQISGEYKVVLVELAYANQQARRIKFVFNKNEKLSGIWFEKTAYIEKDEQTDNVEEVEYEVRNSKGNLTGVLTLPKTSEKPPVAILFENFDSDMNGTIGQAENEPLENVARELAANGIASLRYNMRAYQYAKNVKQSDLSGELFLEDAAQALNQIYTDNRISKNKIIFIAFGESANYMPALVKEKNRVKGVVLVAPSPIYVGEKNYANQKSVVSDVNYFMKENSTIPLFVLNGLGDFEISKEDREGIKELWKGRSHIQYREYKNLNHYLIASCDNMNREDYDRPGTVAKQPLMDICKWMLTL